MLNSGYLPIKINIWDNGFTKFKKVDLSWKMKKWEEVIEEWKGLIRDCENRPDDVRFDDWCRNAGVSN